MARDAVAITAVALNAATTPATGTVINTTNGAYVAAGGNTRRLVIEIKNTAGTTKAATVKAGDNPPAWQQGEGDLTVSIATNVIRYVTLDSARFAQDNGDINIDFASGMTGTVKAYRLPADL